MGIDALRLRLNDKQSQMERVKSDNSALQDKVDALQRIYNELKDAKNELSALRNGVNHYAGKKYDLWAGHLYDQHFNRFLSRTLCGSYDYVIREIDRNMAKVNNERARSQNRILRNEGIIGNLKAAINTIVTQIQNWID